MAENGNDWMEEAWRQALTFYHEQGLASPGIWKPASKITIEFTLLHNAEKVRKAFLEFLLKTEKARLFTVVTAAEDPQASG